MIKGALAIYQVFISPLLHFLIGPGFGCRYLPTCSQYCSESFHIHGPLGGMALSIRRLSRCHPFAQAGYDPVPRDIGKRRLNYQRIQGR